MAQQEPREGRLRPARRITLTDDVYASVQGLIMDHDCRPASGSTSTRSPAGWTSRPPRSARRWPGSSPTAWSARRRSSGYTATPLLTRAEFDELVEMRLILEPARRRPGRRRRPPPTRRRRVSADAAGLPGPAGADGFAAIAAFTAQDALFHHRLAGVSGNRDAARRGGPAARPPAPVPAALPRRALRHQRERAPPDRRRGRRRRRRRGRRRDARAPQRPPGTATCPSSRAGSPMRIALFVTCVNDLMFPDTGKAVVTRPGTARPQRRVPRSTRPAAGRCTPTAVTAPRRCRWCANFVARSTRTTRSWPRPASCVAMVRDEYPRLAPSPALTSVAARTYELSELLVDVLGVTDVGARFPHRVTYHPTCHGLRMLRLGDRPLAAAASGRGIELVAAAGAPRSAAASAARSR